MKIPEGLKCTVTPENRYYPYPVPRIPEGWELIRFGWCETPTDCVVWDNASIPHPPQAGTGEEHGLPSLIVRRKPEKHAYVPLNLPCSTPCKTCGKASDDPAHERSPAKPRRWVVECGMQGDHPPLAGVHCYVSAVVREVKPITREQVRKVAESCSEPAGGFYRVAAGAALVESILRELGIEVGE